MTSTFVSLGRVLDGTVLATFVLVVSGFALYAINLAYYSISVTHKEKLGSWSTAVSNAFPGKKGKLDIEFLHIELFAILVALQKL
jgi:hypothetical protein